jgi:hypothetical protein
MRTLRQVASVVFVLAVVLVPKGPVLSAAVGCTSYPEPLCASFSGLECNEWPQGGCYLATSQQSTGEGGAQFVCEDYVDNSGCGVSVDASADGPCYWFCQWEGPRSR